MSSFNKRWLRFPHRVKSYEKNSERFDEMGHVFKIAASCDDLWQSFRLIYDQYLHEGYISERKNKIFFTKYHLLPETTVFSAKHGCETLATATLVYDSHLFGLPMDHLYQDELDVLRNKERKILEISSLASVMATEWQGVVMNFIRLVFLYSTFQKVNDICIMVNPKHADFYIKSSPFKMFGKEKFYPKVKAPAVALRADVDEIRDFYENSSFIVSVEDHLSSLYHSLKIKLSCNILESICSSQNFSDSTPNPLNGEFISNILLEDKDVSNQLASAEVRAFLREAYPGIRFEKASPRKSNHRVPDLVKKELSKTGSRLMWTGALAAQANLKWNTAVEY
ncbi:hypothetical protein SAMN05660653_02234 [Desulfonatronum thiosulfatophilum]|uniref:N-acyl amino acid synthase FeeM catalytic core domain-containing protein n=1 Tax=Desulfonatronum thiosulfatophilum TaxID=617002 RepID=A0A1G6DKV3_9BACT|nr:hypothetical protein [Desulfonatronum thiosulfatophilum]SDB45741.1 hypothetical protein SAMN05660653_02234 [Desulfonatronum thiosulfatophilum]